MTPLDVVINIKVSGRPENHPAVMEKGHQPSSEAEVSMIRKPQNMAERNARLQGPRDIHQRRQHDSSEGDSCSSSSSNSNQAKSALSGETENANSNSDTDTAGPVSGILAKGEDHARNTSNEVIRSPAGPESAKENGSALHVNSRSRSPDSMPDIPDPQGCLNELHDKPVFEASPQPGLIAHGDFSDPSCSSPEDHEANHQDDTTTDCDYSTRDSKPVATSNPLESTVDNQSIVDDEPPWDTERHRTFVSAVFEIGLKNCSPSVIMDCMKTLPAHISREKTKSHLQKFRKTSDKSVAEFMYEYDEFLTLVEEEHKSGGLPTVPEECSSEIVNMEEHAETATDEDEHFAQKHEKHPSPEDLLKAALDDRDPDELLGGTAAAYASYAAANHCPPKNNEIRYTGAPAQFPVLTESEKKSSLGESLTQLNGALNFMRDFILNSRHDIPMKLDKVPPFLKNPDGSSVLPLLTQQSESAANSAADQQPTKEIKFRKRKASISETSSEDQTSSYPYYQAAASYTQPQHTVQRGYPQATMYPPQVIPPHASHYAQGLEPTHQMGMYAPVHYTSSYGHPPQPNHFYPQAPSGMGGGAAFPHPMTSMAPYATPMAPLQTFHQPIHPSYYALDPNLGNSGFPGGVPPPPHLYGQQMHAPPGVMPETSLDPALVENILVHDLPHPHSARSDLLHSGYPQYDQHSSGHEQHQGGHPSIGNPVSYSSGNAYGHHASEAASSVRRSPSSRHQTSHLRSEDYATSSRLVEERLSPSLEYYRSRRKKSPASPGSEKLGLRELSKRMRAENDFIDRPSSVLSVRLEDIDMPQGTPTSADGVSPASFVVQDMMWDPLVIDTNEHSLAIATHQHQHCFSSGGSTRTEGADNGIGSGRKRSHSRRRQSEEDSMDPMSLDFPADRVRDRVEVRHPYPDHDGRREHKRSQQHPNRNNSSYGNG